jgi:hypothetical protein
MVHPPYPVTKSYSVTHLPVAAVWVIASTTCFLYLCLPWLPPPKGLRLFSSQTFSRTIPHFLNLSHFIPTRVWKWNRHSVLKCWHLNNRHWGITQKKAYDILNMAKVWNHIITCLQGRCFTFSHTTATVLFKIVTYQNMFDMPHYCPVISCVWNVSNSWNVPKFAVLRHKNLMCFILYC